MNAVLMVGIYVSAKIISFIADEMTEIDRIKQKELDDEINRICSCYQEVNPVDANDNVFYQSENVRKKNEEQIKYLIKEAESRESEYWDFHKEIKELKEEAENTLMSKKAVQTPLRRDSLKLLIRQLSEAREKCYSYIQYLGVYCDQVKRCYRNDAIPLFSMQLPTGFPYVGKVIWISSSQLSKNYIEYGVPGEFETTICVTDKELFDIVDKSVIPVMITGGCKRKYYASIEKGAFKAYELGNTHLGLSASVKEIQKNHVILVYRNQLELYLPKNNLIKPDRFPPIRSTLTVYPVKWEYDLKEYNKKHCPVTVSERKEDASSSLEFKCFPICFTEDSYNLFTAYYEKNNLQEYEEEFLIGPVNQEDVALKKGSILKLQFGNIPLFFIEVDEHNDRSDILRYYFRFHHMCNADDRAFSADDIFLPFDVTVSPYFDGTSDEMIRQYMDIDIDDLNDIAAFIWDLFEEFRIQDQMRKDREGVGYFFKWENITKQLINVLEQGDSFKAKIKEIVPEGPNCLFAEVQNTTEMERFIKSFAQKTDLLIMREWRPQFFVKDEFGNRYVTMVVDGVNRLRIIGKDVSEVFTEGLEYIELFASNRPYAEYQQKAALRQFRIGNVVNPLIQAACLNSANIVSSFDNERILLPFQNKVLATNLSQLQAVEKAFKEENIFLIQGPPGTGKTTVIRELVEQELGTVDDSRILIVSQANVAVDNALSGLVEKYSDQIVRCGNGNKISSEFQKLSLHSRCQNYLNELKLRKESFNESFYDNWYKTIIPQDSSYYSPILCELVIRNHRLIGATCVGLAKRNIGLERTEFDLVIIDEAGKALPAELLIPLVRAKKAVIIGDQKQLPPVINPILYDEERIDLEERAVSENDLFCHSFFERLFDNAPESSKVMLDTQYRMPAVIGTAISKLFYDCKLKNGSGTESKKPVLFDSNLSFVDFENDERYLEKKDNKKQITNLVEAEAAVSLTLNIREKDASCSIAIITPYKGQKRLISNTFIKAGKHFKLDKINVDTIDSFQGSEADVVIFCTTRAVQPTLFFRDKRRLNVALSRARRELIVLGRMSYLYKFRKSESCLPFLADYIKKNGNIIAANDCPMIQMPVDTNKSGELILSIDNISLPSAFYIYNFNLLKVQEKMAEFYTYGDFVNPVTVKKTSNGFVLTGSYDQFEAAIELGITECLCKVV